MRIMDCSIALPRLPCLMRNENYYFYKFQYTANKQQKKSLVINLQPTGILGSAASP